MKSTPWWWEAAPLSTGSADPLPESVDVAIVGGGYTGVSAALVLAREGKRVAVLESNELGSGASSRNGGMIGSGHRVALKGLARKYGQEVAQSLLAEGHRALRFTTELIESEAIECHFERCGRFRTAWNAEHFEAMQREADMLQDTFGVDLQMVSAAEQSREIGTHLYHGGCIYLEHGGVHPGLLHRGLTERAAEAGARLFGGCQVTALHRAGQGWRVSSTRGEIACDAVIIATNGYTGSLTGKLRRRAVPVPSYVAVTEEIDPERLGQLFPGGRMMVETRSRNCYYRVLPDANRIMLGARAAVYQISENRAAPVMQRLLEGIFPQLAPVRFSHLWKGNTCQTPPAVPHLGEMDGLYYAMGYSGSGVAMAPYLGSRIAWKLLGDARGETAFDQIRFPPIPAYTGHPWFLPLMEWQLRARDFRENRTLARRA